MTTTTKPEGGPILRAVSALERIADGLDGLRADLRDLRDLREMREEAAATAAPREPLRDDGEWIDLREVAERAGVHQTTAGRAARAGRLGEVREGPARAGYGYCAMVRVDAVDAWVARRCGADAAARRPRQKAARRARSRVESDRVALLDAIAEAADGITPAEARRKLPTYRGRPDIDLYNDASALVRSGLVERDGRGHLFAVGTRPKPGR